MSNWQQSLVEVKNFISENPEIALEAKYTHIPAKVRPEFYNLLKKAGKAFIEEKLAASYSESKRLSESYLKVEKDIIGILGLERISSFPSLEKYLHDPADELVRCLFPNLFYVLKDKINTETFEESAISNVEHNLKSLLELGYEKWVVLSLVKLLNADKVLGVPPLEKPQGALFSHYPIPASMRCGSPRETSRLSFQYKYDLLLVTPDIIVHSVELNRYVATRSQIGKPISTASNATNNREWLPFNNALYKDIYRTPSDLLYTPITLVYIADNPMEVSIVVDAERICKPDLVIMCTFKEEWYHEERFKKAKLFSNSLNPRLGTYIVSKGPIKAAVSDEHQTAQLADSNGPGSDIHILTVGYDRSKLKPIISALSVA